MYRAVLACVILLAVAAMFFMVVEPAVAEPVLTSAKIRGAPAPLIGVGLPLVMGVLAVLTFARGLWRKE